jgi:hypothetical protein
MNLLVSLVTGWGGTIERFAASGNRPGSSAWSGGSKKRGLRRCRSPLLEGSVVCLCRPTLSSFERSRRTETRQTLPVRFGRLSSDRQGQNGKRRRTFQSFPIQPRAAIRGRAAVTEQSPCRECHFFPRANLPNRNNPGFGRLCRRTAPLFVHALPDRKAITDPPSGVLAAPCAASSARATGQPIPIATAIRIRSEWLFAPSFCLRSDVVLATVL